MVGSWCLPASHLDWDSQTAIDGLTGVSSHLSMLYLAHSRPNPKTPVVGGLRTELPAVFCPYSPVPPVPLAELPLGGGGTGLLVATGGEMLGFVLRYSDNPGNLLVVVG